MDRTRGIESSTEVVLAKLVPWATKGGLAVLDQALFAGANFAVNILLARWLTLADYGAYALAYSIFLLFGTFHTALLTEPMMVFGAGKYAEHFERYLGILLRGHFRLMLPSVFILLGGSFLLGRVYSVSVQHAFLGLALAAPLILLLWLVRRGFYVRLQPAWPTIGGVFYLVFLVTVIYGLHVGGRLSPQTTFLGMGVIALAVSAFLLLRLNPSWVAAQGNPTAAMVVADHWRYGRWAMATGGMQWFPTNFYYALLAVWIGLEGSGVLQALMNLAMPALHSINALSMILLPLLVRERQQGGTRSMARTMKFALALFLSGSVLYLGVLWGFRYEILQFLYGGKYQEYGLLPVFLVGLLPLGASVSAALGSALRALQRPDWLFWCYAGSSIVAVVAGIPLALTLGISGALIAILLSSMGKDLLMLLFYKSSLRQETSS